MLRRSFFVLWSSEAHWSWSESIGAHFRDQEFMFMLRSSFSCSCGGDLRWSRCYNIEIGTDGSEVEIYLDSAAGDDRLEFNHGISDNTWYHLAVTYDQDQSDETTLYIDGSEVESWSDARGKLDKSTGSPVTIGDTDHISAPFTGLIDEVAVWTKVLTSSQISAIYNSGSGIGNVATSYSVNLELYIKFEQDLNDDSGNSHNGTFSGSNGANSSATYVNITSDIPLN